MKLRIPLAIGLLIAASPAHAAYVWVGNNDGLTLTGTSPFDGNGQSTYSNLNWENSANPGNAAPVGSVNNSAGTPSGINNALIINNGFVSGGANGAGSTTALLRTNGHALTVSGEGSGLKMAVTGGGAGSFIENDGTIGGPQSILSVSGGGFVSTGRLIDIAATLDGVGSSIVFISEGDNGLDGFNSTINLTGGFGNESPSIYWSSVTAEQLFVAGVLGSLTVNGAPAVWGNDPLVEEPGDNVIFTPVSFNNTATVKDFRLPQNNYYASGQPLRSGFVMTAIPEPASALLGLLGAGMFLRRRRP
jgi:hypothetical protein